MSFKSYDDIEPKNDDDVAKLYKRVNNLLRMLWIELEKSYNGTISKKERNILLSIHFKVRRMVKCYKYLENELNATTSASNKKST